MYIEREGGLGYDAHLVLHRKHSQTRDSFTNLVVFVMIQTGYCRQTPFRSMALAVAMRNPLPMQC